MNRGIGFFAVVLLVLCTGSQGCDEPRSGDRGYTQTRIADTILVHNLTPLHSSPAVLEPEVRIGRIEGPDELTFVSIRSLAVGPGGNIYVGGVSADGGIRRFSRHGEFEEWVARAGPGPMEVGLITALSVNKNGALAAKDRSDRHIKVFFPGGGFLTFPAPSSDPERYHEDALQYHRDGTLWAGINPPLYQSMRPIPYPRPIFARISESGEAVDTIFAPDWLGDRCLLGDNRYLSGVWQDLRDPWFPLGKWALGPDGTLALGCPAEYVLDVVRTGQPVLRISREWTPVSTDPGEYEYWGNRPLTYPWALPLPPFPEERPAYARIILPGDGRIWVWPVHPSQRLEAPERQATTTGQSYYWWVATTGAFDVFREDGRWLGKVQLPPELRYSGYLPPNIVIRGDTIWAPVEDSLDVEYVARYRVRWPEEDQAPES